MRCLLILLLLNLAAAMPAAADDTLPAVVDSVQPKMVKIYGSGGIRGLEAYQSGFLISPEGHVLTVWSYVLDSEELLNVVLNDGRRFPGKLVNHDPRLEIAILKIDVDAVEHFDLGTAVELQPGEGVLAFSNLYGVASGSEPTSVLQGRVSARTELSARRGAFESIYSGPVYVVDAMTNNPGAAGGALTDRNGQIVGMLGKELRSSLNNVWLNYAIPVSELSQSVEDILAGKNPPRREDEEAKKPDRPLTLDLLGIVLLPDLLSRTPPYVDQIRPNSAASRAKLRSDDLILFINDIVADSSRDLKEELSYIDRIDPVRLTVQRGQQLIDVELKLTPEEAR